MSLVKKFVIAGSLGAILSLSGFALSKENVREYLCEKFDSYGASVLGCAAGVYVSGTKKVKGFIDEIESEIRRAALEG